MYMKPWSSGSPSACPPPAMALSTRSSTCSLLSADRPNDHLSALRRVGDVLLREALDDRLRVQHGYESSLMTMHVVFSSENRSLNEKPSVVKNPMVFARSFTGRLMNWT
jgi:hypothetical protein